MGVPAAIPASSWLPPKSPCGVWKGLAILTWGGAECLADYTAKVKLNVKVLDFVQLGGASPTGTPGGVRPGRWSPSYRRERRRPGGAS